jgi:CelD/BcsL family acetyltransferase involved in cellulose biosynthesis
MEMAARHGWLRLGLLFLDDRPIAALFWLFRQRRCYSVKTAYDEEFKRFAPGNLVMWRLLERLIEDEQMQFFDWLQGDDAYKKNWSNQRRERLAMIAYPKGLRGTCLRLLDRNVLPWIRQSRYLNQGKRLLAPWLQRPDTPS